MLLIYDSISSTSTSTVLLLSTTFPSTTVCTNVMTFVTTEEKETTIMSESHFLDLVKMCQFNDKLKILFMKNCLPCFELAMERKRKKKTLVQDKSTGHLKC